MPRSRNPGQPGQPDSYEEALSPACRAETPAQFSEEITRFLKKIAIT